MKSLTQLDLGSPQDAVYCFAIATLLVYIIYRLIPSQSRDVRFLPGPASADWLLGNLVDFYSPAGENSVSVKWYRQYGRILRFKGFLGRDHIQIGDPAAMAHLLNAGPYKYEKDTVEKPRFESMFGAGLLSANGETHKKLRRIILPAFGTAQINALAPIFERCAIDVKDRWLQQVKTNGGETEINLALDCSFGLLNAIGEAAFGYEFDVFNKGSSTPLFQALVYLDSISSTRSYKQILLESFADRFPGWMVDIVLSLPIRNGRVLRHQLDVMKMTAAELFNCGLADAKMESQLRKDLLSVLVKANLESSSKFQLKAEEVQAQLMTFIMAGWEVQAKLRAELQALGSSPTLAQLQKAVYLDAVLKEAVRVVGVTPLERIATQDDIIPLSKPITLKDGTSISQLHIRKGQSLSIPIQAMNFDEARFGYDAHVFKPERWLGPEGESLRSYTGYGPGTWHGLANFGGGTRSCIGSKFAMVELRIFAYVFLTHFSFEQGAHNEWMPKARLVVD